MKTVIITGGASGLGLAIAHEFYKHNYNLVILDVDHNAIKKCRKLFARDKLLTIKCDITDPESCKRAVTRTLKQFEHIDVLVNNAGVSHRSLFLNTKTEVLKRTMEINYFGVLYITHACLPHILKQKGSIIGISSVAGLGPLLGRTGYCASKYAIRGFFDTLRCELKKQIQILMVYPAFIQTGLEANATDGSGQKLGDNKRKNIGQPVTASYAALQIVKALHNGKDQLFLSKVARISWMLVRFFPKLYVYIMTKKTAAEFDV